MNANSIKLVGILENSTEEQTFENRGKVFHRFTLRCKRQSNVDDLIPIVIPEKLLYDVDTSLFIGKQIKVQGNIRTRTVDVGGRYKLYVYIYVQEFLLLFEKEEDNNVVELFGTLCRPTSLRTTPKGKQITELCVAVNRQGGGSDYIPCIAWGRNAVELNNKSAGYKLSLTGRFQSREYIKKYPDKEEVRVAYEISIKDYDEIES